MFKSFFFVFLFWCVFLRFVEFEESFEASINQLLGLLGSLLMFVLNTSHSLSHFGIIDCFDLKKLKTAKNTNYQKLKFQDKLRESREDDPPITQIESKRLDEGRWEAPLSSELQKTYNYLLVLHLMLWLHPEDLLDWIADDLHNLLVDKFSIFFFHSVFKLPFSWNHFFLYLFWVFLFIK